MNLHRPIDAVTPSEDLATAMRRLGERARTAYRLLAQAEDAVKNRALLAAAEALRDGSAELLAANAEDRAAAARKALSAALLDRLELDRKRIEAMATGLEEIARLPDPVGRVLDQRVRPNGLRISRISVPLGVIGIIYESRPNVTADAAGLCLKSGNAAILRGGTEAFASNRAIMRCMSQGLAAAGLPEAVIQLVGTTDRAAVGEMLRMTGLIDVIVPRGGVSLTRRIAEESLIPTILHLDGNNHTYLHESADPAMAASVVVNAKLRRTGVCGATESLLIDRAIAPALLPKIADALIAGGCEIRGDAESRAIDPRLVPATDEDWDTEYLDRIVSVKTVAEIDEAIDHINRHGSHHTDAVITADEAAAAKFLAGVDSAIVLHNASTQFADGGEFGMGAEIGISTGRLHARGPVGAEQLTTYKYVVRGDGTVRP